MDMACGSQGMRQHQILHRNHRFFHGARAEIFSVTERLGELRPICPSTVPGARWKRNAGQHKRHSQRLNFRLLGTNFCKPLGSYRATRDVCQVTNGDSFDQNSQRHKTCSQILPELSKS